MKTIFYSKTAVLLCTISFLFACNEMDELDSNNELMPEQEILNPDGNETFVSSNKAIEVANLFFSRQTEGNISTKNGLKTGRSNPSVETITASGNPLMHVINYPEGGFAIVSATKNYYPILAYSDENPIDLTIEIPGLSSWLKEISEAIIASEVSDDTIKSEMQYKWKSYETRDISPSSKTSQLKNFNTTEGQACLAKLLEYDAQYSNQGWAIGPLSGFRTYFYDNGMGATYENLSSLAGSNRDYVIVGVKEAYSFRQNGPLLTTQWHQDSPYNYLIPASDPAGCAAIAVGQIMAYHKFPYLAYINWNAMDNGGVATLIADIGHRVNMTYWASGSWALPGNVESGIKSYGYKVNRTNVRALETEREIYANRPVLMVGGTINLPGDLALIGDGHYWVCDGARESRYETFFFADFPPYGTSPYSGMNVGTVTDPNTVRIESYVAFHMNWGWGGKNDGWFAPTNVNSGNGNYQYSRQNYYISK